MNDPAPRTRPTTLSDYHARQETLFSPEVVEHGLALKLRPTDVVITPFAKSGTAWMQQIVHTRRTGGDMDFDDISRVIPWIEVSHAIGIDLDGERRAEPRAFKSHLEWGPMPKGGKYINVVRDPGDALVSLFKFSEGWFFEPGSISLEEFAWDGFIEKRGYYKHLKSWWVRRNDPDVLERRGSGSAGQALGRRDPGSSGIRELYRSHSFPRGLTTSVAASGARQSG